MSAHPIYVNVHRADRIVIREGRTYSAKTRWFLVECYNGEEGLVTLSVFPPVDGVPISVTFEPYRPDPINLTASSAPQDPIPTLDTDPAP